MIAELKEKSSFPYLILDAGNTLFKRKSRPSPNKLKAAESIIKAYQHMEIDAVAVGAYDLSAGVEYLLNNEVSDILLSSNIVFEKTAEPVFNDIKIIKKNSTTVGIFALTDTVNFIEPGYKILPTNLAISRSLEKLHSKVDLIILLSNLPTNVNKQIANQFKKIQVIISSDKKKRAITPTQINNSILTQTVDRGKSLGVLEISVGQDKIWLPNYKKQIGALNKNIEAAKWQKRRVLTKKDQLDKNKDLIEKIEEVIARSEQELETILIEKKNFSDKYSYSEFIYQEYRITKKIKQDKATLSILQK